ncbi:hypothetical protein [Paracoccus contaminans]|uniref:Uncharacterized protein n=1 Tax=Paracoccus contaminans TaxID=1945662 RepID=A0A1W6CVT1_9RHOB|nr:hypothetical protein [Paracoccus contaminans]ARJ68960.1 hypothetical protein B0A89_04270 [Paracoccus contaminans]
MFVIRYLMVALAVLSATLAFGLGAGLGGWRIAGLMALVALALQAGVVGYVALLAFRPRPWRGDTAKSGLHNSHLVILPK